MSDFLRALLPAVLFFLGIWSLVWDDVAGAGLTGLHYLPDLIAIAASVLAATASMSGSNPGWKIVFRIVIRIAIILFAVDLGLNSFDVSSTNTHTGRLVLGIMVHVAIAATMLLLVFFGPQSGGAAGTSSHDWSEAVRSFLTPMRNNIAHLVIIVIILAAGITGFIIHCVNIADDKYPIQHTAANFFGAAFIIAGYLGALLLAAGSAFFFLTGSTSEILEYLHSGVSALATFFIAFAAGYWANQQYEADSQVAAVVMDAIVIVAMLFLSVIMQMSPFASASYEPIGDAKPPVRA